jgi:uncharacterized protein
MTPISFHIVDRRLNPSGKNSNNRRRFIDRVKKNIDVSKGLQKRGIGDESEEEVTISKDGIEEPSFQYDYETGGVWDRVFPGNKEYNVGDSIPRPRKDGGGKGRNGSTDGDGDDEFRFALSREEYLEVLFGDLELPDMLKDTEKHVMSWTMRRAGYSPVGPTSNLALEQTMIKSIGRRLALKTPKLILLKALEEELENDTDEEKRLALEMQIEELRARANGIPFLDKTDLRYHNTIKTPLPITQAVMYCLMDVSGSMTEHMKDLAKRFYILLYIFLKRIYKDVEVVFIRHTHEASIVDEDTFFHSTETGGTIVSTAYEVMRKDIIERFPVDEWNIYGAQCSDGDNSGGDNDKVKKYLGGLLPWLQYLTYVEVGRNDQFTKHDSDLLQVIKLVQEVNPNKIAVRHLNSKEEVVPVFRSLFVKKAKETT